jgi:hypothetical protein
MHQLVILTALTATSGLFGGGGGGGMFGGGHRGCGRPAMSCHQAPACGPRYMVTGCSQGYAYPAHQAPMAAPVHAPAPASPQAPAMAPPPPPQAAFYPSYYFSSGTPGCSGGNCYRR